MSERPIEAASQHRQAWEVIPWVINGSATAAQRRLLDAHLGGCDECRLELARQRELQSAIVSQSLPAVGDVEVSLQRLFARIARADEDAQAAAAAPPQAARRAPASGLTLWLAAAVLVEAVALAVIGTALVARGPLTGYVTLGDGAAARGVATIRVVPAPSLRIDDLQRLLRTLDLQVVAGPNSVGAYDLAPRSEHPARELQISTLRADPGLKLVEPIDAPGAPR